MKKTWEIEFAHKITTKTFTRTAETEDQAILEAQEGFQEVYGYWPTHIVSVKKIAKKTSPIVKTPLI